MVPGTQELRADIQHGYEGTVLYAVLWCSLGCCPTTWRCSQSAKQRHTTIAEPPAPPDPQATASEPAAVSAADIIVYNGIHSPASEGSSLAMSSSMSSSGNECRTLPEKEFRKDESSGASVPSIGAKWILLSRWETEEPPRSLRFPVS